MATSVGVLSYAYWLFVYIPSQIAQMFTYILIRCFVSLLLSCENSCDILLLGTHSADISPSSRITYCVLKW